MLVSHIIVTLFHGAGSGIFVLLLLSFIIDAIERVDVLLDGLPCRALHLEDEDSHPNCQKDEKKGEHADC